MSVNRLLWSVLLYTILALTIGFKTKFFKLEIERDWMIICRVAVTTLIAPAIIEELLFRVFLLPHPLEDRSPNFKLVWILISLLLFIIYHPINGLTLYVAGLKTFVNPVFLFLATGLGIFCTYLYLASGSLWLPVVFHWLAVVVWLLCLGGNTKLT